MGHIVSLKWTLLLVLGLTTWNGGYAQEGEPKTKTIDVTISPRAITDDSLSMKLLPEENELKDGNASVVLLRMIYERTNYMQQVVPKFKGWLDAPFDDRDMRSGLSFEHFYGQLRRAAYIRNAEWNYPIDEESMVSILLPDVNMSRVFLGRGLSLYIRKAVAEGNAELAQEAVLVGLACSRHYARTPFLVCNLIGIHCAKQVLNQADLLIQMPKAENLFWAYQKLPRPLFDLGPASSLEAVWLERAIPALMERPWPTHEEANKWAEIGGQIMGLGVINIGRALSPLESAAVFQKLTTYLKDNWAEIGDETRDEAELMSAEELACRFFIHKSKQISLRFQAALALDPPEGLKMMVETTEQLKALSEEMEVELLKDCFADLSQSYISAWAPTRKVVALQTIEALRHYAATNGQLPKSLEEISGIPIPVDPFTQKPMGYKLGEGSATLIMINPNVIAGKKGVDRIENRYRVTLAK